MNNFFNSLHNNHNSLYKIFLFLITTVLIVYLFPKSGSFRYSFEKGKPWQSENLYAPFDFAIQKSDKEIDLEKQLISSESSVFFDLDTTVLSQVSSNHKRKFDETFFQTQKDTLNVKLYNKSLLILDELYKNGVLPYDYNFNSKKIVKILVNNTQVKSVRYGQLFPQSDLNKFIDSTLLSSKFKPYIPNIKSIFFDVIVPNISYNEKLTKSAIEDRVNLISLVRGRVEKGTLIISKGEVVKGDKLAV